MKKDFRSLMQKKPFVMAVSLLLALAVWSVVTMSIYRTTTRTIDGVAIELPSFGTSYQSLGLDVIDNGQSYTCSVTVSGDRAVIGALTSSDIIVTPDFSSVTQEGDYSLTLRAAKANQLQNYTIESINPHVLNLTFGEVESLNITVTPSVSGFTVSEGYIIQPITCSPKSVNIIGDAEDLEKISRVVAESEYSGSVSAPFTVRTKVKLLDADGNELPTDKFRLDTDTVELTVPIYREGILPISVGFVNAPEGFDFSVLRYNLSVTSIKVAGTEEAMRNLSEKRVGYIDFAHITPDAIFSFPIQLSSGYVNMDSTDTVSVTFDLDGYVTRKLNISDIRVENVPAGYKVKIVTGKISSVTFLGIKSEVESLSAGSVIAVVDAADIGLAAGTHMVPVSFRIPSCQGTWVTGTYTVVVEVSREG